MAAFNLDAFERGALLVCLAAHLDLRYERLYGYLQDDVTRKRPSVNLVLNLLCAPGEDRLNRLAYFAEGAPLVNHHLLERVVPFEKTNRLTLTIVRPHLVHLTDQRPTPFELPGELGGYRGGLAEPHRPSVGTVPMKHDFQKHRAVRVLAIP